MEYESLNGKRKLKLWLRTLFYHSAWSFDYCFDVAIEPLMNCMDSFSRKYMGRIFVCFVIGLVAFMTFAAHALGVQFWWERSAGFTVLLILCGHWILMNIAFNYYQAVRVAPGQPTDLSKLGGCSISVCHKCISPKPPRTHHCSVCDRCFLKMDHHCPWINNCVGHYNHRYFYLTAAYIVLGLLFIMVFGMELAFRHMVLGEDILDFPRHTTAPMAEEGLLGSVLKQGEVEASPPLRDMPRIRLLLQVMVGFPGGEGSMRRAKICFGLFSVSHFLVRTMLYLVGIVCIGGVTTLGGLLWWHGTLVSKGETSIEYHINKSNRRKYGDRYVNLYDSGRRKNWEVFLGLDQPGRSFWRHILFPSAHPPTGNGYEWSHLLMYTKHRPSEGDHRS